ncbi:MAG: amidohydrolase family protein [Hyphomicrobiaceae bacterium]|nr:amidohydrolase family protein [Hyphomicrobiaceae bacterium]
MAGKYKEDQDCVIEAGWALVDRNGKQELERDVSIVIRGNEIVEIRKGRVRGWEVRVDASDCIVLPGFISGHTHTTVSSPARGLIESGRFMDRPCAVTVDFDDEVLDALTAYNIAEIVKSGCTTFVEMSSSVRYAKSFVRVAKAWGVRAYVSVITPYSPRMSAIWYRTDDKVLFDSIPQTMIEIEEARQYALQLKAEGDDLIRPQMAIHAADTHTPETLAAVKAAAAEVGNGVHIHLSQRIREVEACERLWGKRPVAWLESEGFFDQHVIAAHLYKMDTEKDPEILKRNGVNYVHCACMASMLHQASQPLPEALAGGLNISLGIDQIGNDYLENIKLATLNGQLRMSLLQQYSKAKMRKPLVTDTVHAATLGGAKMLRRDDLGRLAPGAKADLCTVDVTKPLGGVGALPPEPLHHLLYSSGRNVRDVMINGRFKVQNGNLMVANEDRVVAEGGEAAKKIWAALEKEDWFNAPPPPNSRG